MFKVLAALCIVAAVLVCSAHGVAVPIFKQPYGVGDISTRINKGHEAAIGQFPYMAIIRMDNKRSSYFCAGSLISKNWVLTAASCIFGYKSWTVMLGVHFLRSSDHPNRVVITSNEAIYNENFNNAYYAKHNVGVIKLPTDAPLNNFINIIDLPPRSWKTWKDENFENRVVRYSGWHDYNDNGSNLPLQFVDLYFDRFDSCRYYYGKRFIANEYCTFSDYPRGEDACNSDEGGPLTIGSGQNLTQIGIYNYGNCHDEKPTVFTAVPHFVDWISNKTGIPVRDN